MKMNSKNRIVIVDDDPDYIYLVEHSMANSTFACQLSGLQSGTELFNWLAVHQQPSVILLDINMPGTNGFQVLEALKTSEKYKTIPVVMLTVSSYKPDVSRAYQIGANGFIIKPSSFERLTNHMELLCQFWFDIASTPSSIKGYHG